MVENGVNAQHPVLRKASMANTLDKAQATASGVCVVCLGTKAQNQSEDLDVG
jgi:hypothetical protein